MERLGALSPQDFEREGVSISQSSGTRKLTSLNP